MITLHAYLEILNLLYWHSKVTENMPQTPHPPTLLAIIISFGTAPPPPREKKFWIHACIKYNKYNGCCGQKSLHRWVFYIVNHHHKFYNLQTIFFSASFIKLFYNQFNTAVNFSTGFGFFNIITNNSIVKSILKR